MNGDKILERYVAVMPHSLRTMTMETRDLEEINEYVQNIKHEERKRAFAVVKQYIPAMASLISSAVYKDIMGDLYATRNPDQLEFDFDGTGIS
jgi:hypothetical protein